MQTGHDPDMFEMVCRMNEAFGNARGNPTSIDPSMLDRERINMLKELEELRLALLAGRLDKARDAICDTVVFAMGAYHKMGIDMHVDMTAVLYGVMTRFVKDEDDFKATKAKYEAMGIKVTFEGSFPNMICRSAVDQGDGEYPKGKFLKSASFHEPTLPSRTEDLAFISWRNEGPGELPALGQAERSQPTRRFMGGRRKDDPQ